MASRKHCLSEAESELDYQCKRFCHGNDTDEGKVLQYNPSYLAVERISLNCPGYTVEELRKIARQLGISIRGLSKSELVSAIRTQPL
jgi:hypothetical protein